MLACRCELTLTATTMEALNLDQQLSTHQRFVSTELLLDGGTYADFILDGLEIRLSRDDVSGGARTLQVTESFTRNVSLFYISANGELVSQRFLLCKERQVGSFSSHTYEELPATLATDLDAVLRGLGSAQRIERAAPHTL